MVHSSKHVTRLVFATLTLSVLASSAILPILAPLMRSLHLSASQAGWMLSIGSLAMALAAPAWGAANDRFGRRFVLLAGFAGMGLAYAAFAAVVRQGEAAALAGGTLFACMVAARGALGVFLPAVPSATQALVADCTGEGERSTGMATIGAANGAGLVLGPALSGLLAQGGLVAPLAASAALCVAGGIVAATLRRPAPAAARAGTGRRGLPEGLPRWLLASMLTWSAIVTVQVSVGFYFQDRLGLRTAEATSLLAMALTLVGLALLAVQLVQVKLLRWAPRRLVVSGALCWMAGMGVLIVTANVPAYFAAYALLGVGSGLLLPGTMAGASLAVPAERQGAVAGLTAAAQGAGFVVAPIVSTMLYERGPTLPLWGLVAVMGVLLALFGAAPARLARAV